MSAFPPLPLGPSAKAASLPITIATDEGAIPVSIAAPMAVTGTFYQATQPVSIAGTVAVSGPLTDTQIRASSLPVSLPVYTVGTPTSATATTSSGALLAANASRKAAVFVNNGSADVFLAVGTSALANKGITLKANGGSYEISSMNLTTALVNCITASGTASVSVFEGA